LFFFRFFSLKIGTTRNNAVLSEQCETNNAIFYWNKTKHEAKEQQETSEYLVGTKQNKPTTEQRLVGSE
jgi:hypothetical protein